MKRRWMRRILAALLVCGILLSVDVATAAQEEIRANDLYATSAVLMDGESGRILYEKNGSQIMPMASTTKIMTCIVALEYGDLSDEVTVSAYAASQPKVHLGMSKGNVYKMEDLLYSLMLESHNDTAVAIAEHIGGQKLNLPDAAERTSEESKQAVAAFAELMNGKASEIGCENTWYITPNGLDATQAVLLENGETAEKIHSTTAAELALVMRYCAWLSPQRENFLNITRRRSYSFTDVSGKRSHSCTNHNSFLDMMEGALTGKTGFTNAAGYCYVGALEQDGRKYTVALLACGWPNNKNWKWADTRTLMEYGLENYEIRRLEDFVYDENRLQDIVVEEGQTGKLGEQASVNVKIERAREPDFPGMLLGSWEEIQVDCQMETKLQAPVTEGAPVGSITYSLQGKTFLTERILAAETVDKINFYWCLGKIISFFLIL